MPAEGEKIYYIIVYSLNNCIHGFVTRRAEFFKKTGWKQAK
jgi:hypothetical protein